MGLRFALLASFVAASLAAVACGDGYGDEDSTPTSAVVATPTVVVPPVVAEPTVEDGISAIEAIVNAAVANDVESLISFIRYTPTACAVETGGSGGPPQCRPDEPDGTMVDVLQMTTCEGEWRRADEVFFDPVAAGTVTFVGAFVAPEEFYPPGETVLVFTRLMSGLSELGWELVLDGGAIVGEKYGCGETAAELIEFQGLSERVPVGSALPAASGIESVDRAIAAMLSGDVRALREMLVFTQTACSSVQDFGTLACVEGEAEGAVSDAFPIAHCHGSYARPDEIRDELFGNVVGFYGAYRLDGEGWLPGDYAAIFVRRPTGDLERSAVELVVSDDGIVGMHTGCGMTPEAMVEFQGLTDVLIAPAE